MCIRAFKGSVGILLLVTAFGAYAQSGGGVPISPAQASAMVAQRATDKQITADVLAAITNAGVDGSKVKVRAYNGMVTLRGSVPKAEQVQTAIDAAKAVQHVTAVKSRLHVRK
ncbi:BON domain-containing protein [Burkholderia gladioli]|uniref:BON domain-containing protein n=1 Tax=Burkholderia gladioli TaxID=28095 RepID=UPI00163DF2E4|nr:BON domain-containing protein [Burkholderia gladioli]